MMAKATTYLFFALAIIIAVGVLYLVARAIWLYWNITNNSRQSIDAE